MLHVICTSGAIQWGLPFKERSVACPVSWIDNNLTTQNLSKGRKNKILILLAVNSVYFKWINWWNKSDCCLKITSKRKCPLPKFLSAILVSHMWKMEELLLFRHLLSRLEKLLTQWESFLRYAVCCLVESQIMRRRT